MDCSICTTMPYMLRPPRNTVCAICYEGARNIISLINKFEHQQEEVQKSHNLSPSPNSCKTLMDVSRWILGMINKVNEQLEEANFLGEMVSAFKEQIHSDILVIPGNGGPLIPAHKAILAVRSEIFKNMLECDEFKAAPIPNSTITLAELNHEELECLLEFLYNGRVTKERLDKHVYTMLHTADKYEIPYLQKLCEGHMLDSLNVSNALDVLEASDICSNKELKDTTLNFIVKNMEEIVFSSKYDVFALKSPHLSVQITRATLKTLKKTLI